MMKILSPTHKPIVINSLSQEQPNFIQRRRFIIAHEYAHYILHKKDDTRQYAHRDTSEKDALIEKEADFFARCLLMPEAMVQTLLSIPFVKNTSFETKVALVSRFFNVTKKKSDQRL